MELTTEELRVLACLIEKSFTTPDQYPLTTNALTAACNQKTSREPVVDYPSSLVDSTMQLLRDAGWARSVRSSGSRAFKHKQVADEKLGVGDRALAVLAVLALRGPQSVGELTTRTERYGTFDSGSEIESTLDALARSEPPLVANVGRRPGQSQDRWIQLIGATGDQAGDGAGYSTGHDAGTGTGGGSDSHDGPARTAPAVAMRADRTSIDPDRGTAASSGVHTPDSTRSDLASLEERMARLEARVAELESLFD